MNRLLFILLLPVFLFGQGGDPSQKIQTFNDLQNLVNYGGYFAKITITPSSEAVTVLEAKNTLHLDETGIISTMTNNRVVPRYALTAKSFAPILSLVPGSVTTSGFSVTWTDPRGGATMAQTSDYLETGQANPIWATGAGSPIPPRTFSNLVHNSTYYVRVQLLYSDNTWSPYSNILTVHTLLDTQDPGDPDPDPDDPNPPVPPESVIYTMNNIGFVEYVGPVSSGNINLLFYAPTLLNATPSYYQLEYKLNSSPTWLVYGTNYPYVVGGLRYNVTGLVAPNKYDFRIRFYTTAGQWSNYSNTYTLQLSAFSDFRVEDISWENATLKFTNVPPIQINGQYYYPTKYTIEWDAELSTDGITPPIFNTFAPNKTMEKEVKVDNQPNNLEIIMWRGADMNADPDDLCPAFYGTPYPYMWYKVRIKTRYTRGGDWDSTGDQDSEWSDWIYYAMPQIQKYTINTYNPSTLNYTLARYCTEFQTSINAFSWWDEFTVSNFNFKVDGVSRQSSSSPIFDSSFIWQSSTLSVTATLDGGGNQTKYINFTILSGSTVDNDLIQKPVWILNFIPQ
jgi:hypothetical protein